MQCIYIVNNLYVRLCLDLKDKPNGVGSLHVVSVHN